MTSVESRYLNVILLRAVMCFTLLFTILSSSSCQEIELDTSWLKYRNEFMNDNVAHEDTCHQNFSVVPISFYDSIDDSDYARTVDKFGKIHYLWYIGNDSIRDSVVVQNGLAVCYDKAGRIVNKSMYYRGIVLWDTTYNNYGSIKYSTSFDTITGIYEEIQYLPNGDEQVVEIYKEESLIKRTVYPQYKVHPSDFSISAEIDLNRDSVYVDTLIVRHESGTKLTYEASDNVSIKELSRLNVDSDSVVTIFYKIQLYHDFQKVYNFGEIFFEDGENQSPIYISVKGTHIKYSDLTSKNIVAINLRNKQNVLLVGEVGTETGVSVYGCNAKESREIGYNCCKIIFDSSIDCQLWEISIGSCHVSGVLSVELK